MIEAVVCQTWNIGDDAVEMRLPVNIPALPTSGSMFRPNGNYPFLTVTDVMMEAGVEGKAVLFMDGVFKAESKDVPAQLGWIESGRDPDDTVGAAIIGRDLAKLERSDKHGAAFREGVTAGVEAAISDFADLLDPLVTKLETSESITPGEARAAGMGIRKAMLAIVAAGASGRLESEGGDEPDEDGHSAPQGVH